MLDKMSLRYRFGIHHANHLIPELFKDKVIPAEVTMMGCGLRMIIRYGQALEHLLDITFYYKQSRVEFYNNGNHWDLWNPNLDELLAHVEGYLNEINQFEYA